MKINKAKEKLFGLLVESGEFTKGELIQLAILCGRPTTETFKCGNRMIKRTFHKDGISQEQYITQTKGDNK